MDQHNEARESAAERRAYPRAVAKIEIDFKDTIDFIRSYMLNISGGGLFIKTDEALLLDTIVLLRFTVPGYPLHIEAEGKVVWSNPKGGRGYFPKGMGIKFTKLDSDDADRIKTFVDKNYDQIAHHSFF